jgi:hypothetical protein
MSLRPPLGPASSGPLGGLHRTRFQKRKKPKQICPFLHFSFPKPFKNSKFRMIFLALIPVMIYYA